MKELDIRPNDLFNRYLELSAEDAQVFFSGAVRVDRRCVACNSNQKRVEFKKHGFEYASCKDCGTLYQTPRPQLEAFEAFYKDSISSRYWAEEFFPSVMDARREIIFRPRAQKLLEMCELNGVEARNIIDVGAGYGIFLDEWKRLRPGGTFTAIEPSSIMAAQCRSKGHHVIEDIVENISSFQGRADLVVCFEVLEHVFDPFAFISSLARLASLGGHVLVSTLCVDGFDIQMLWERSNSISPPHHINFISLEGFDSLFKRAGLEVLSITTPGKLDVDIVRNAYLKDPEMLPINKFLCKLLMDHIKSSEFQTFLEKNCLSSHAWVLAKKV